MSVCRLQALQPQIQYPVYNPPEVNRRLWVYYNKIPVYPIFYLRGTIDLQDFPTMKLVWHQLSHRQGVDAPGDGHDDHLGGRFGEFPKFWGIRGPHNRDDNALGHKKGIPRCMETTTSRFNL